MGIGRKEINAPASTPLSSGEITPANSPQPSLYTVDIHEATGISQAYRNQTENSIVANSKIPEVTNPIGIAIYGLDQNIRNLNGGISPINVSTFTTTSFAEVVQRISELREDALRRGALFGVEIADEEPIDGVGEVLGRTILVDNLLEAPKVEQDLEHTTEITVPTLASKLESIRQIPSHILVYIIDSGPLLEERKAA